MRLGSIIALTAFFVVSSAMAQQVSRGEQLLGADGTLIPDFERSDREPSVGPGNELVVQAPVRVNEPQDPLNQSYANAASTAIDQLY